METHGRSRGCRRKPGSPALWPRLPCSRRPDAQGAGGTGWACAELPASPLPAAEVQANGSESFTPRFPKGPSEEGRKRICDGRGYERPPHSGYWPTFCSCTFSALQTIFRHDGGTGRPFPRKPPPLRLEPNPRLTVWVWRPGGPTLHMARLFPRSTPDRGSSGTPTPRASGDTSRAQASAPTLGSCVPRTRPHRAASKDGTTTATFRSNPRWPTSL